MTAIEPATQNAVDYDALTRQAEMLATATGVIPKQYRNRPGDILAAAVMGAELGFGPMTALRSIHVVEGKPQLSAEAMVAIVRRAGHSLTGTTSASKAWAKGTRRDTGDTMEVTFTIEDARRAGLANKGPWKSYPAAMLWARACSNVCRQLFPDVALGSYAFGEIEPTEWEQPDRSDVIDTDLAEPAEAMASPNDVNELLAECLSLSEESQTRLLNAFAADDIELLEHQPLPLDTFRRARDLYDMAFEEAAFHDVSPEEA